MEHSRPQNLLESMDLSPESGILAHQVRKLSS